MRKTCSLRTRLFIILGALVLVTLAGGSLMIWYTYQIGSLFQQLVHRDLQAFETAEGLENALVNQKGFVSYYFMDGNPEWLEKLQEYRGAFQNRLARAQALVTTAEEQETIDRIQSEYTDYVTNKDKVIDLYKLGRREAGTSLHQQVRQHFFSVLELCERHKDRHLARIEHARNKTEAQSRQLRIVAGSGIWTAAILGGLLAFLLLSRILNPLRRLVSDDVDCGNHAGFGAENEVTAVSHRFQDLRKDIGLTKTQLARSQEHLLQSEKLALVGRLAAGVAHSIRNPLTSVKMRLFSLERSLDLSNTQREDLEVISDEIRHLDNVVGNFLEFSRPPKLRKQEVSPSDVVDMALDLLRYRLESYNAKIELQREKRLPFVSIDAEQLKEVLVNLAINACEAAGPGVQIRISEEQRLIGSLGECIVIELKDNGPGIPQEIIGRVTEPFFTTKEEGTGLGLSIAERILKEHGGFLTVSANEGMGSVFSITIPIVEVDIEQHIDR